jgi:hypothetical protein
MTGLRFTDGIEFDFTEVADPFLSAGQCVLLVKNVGAFAARYGLGLPVVGQYSGQLSNGGEHIELTDAAGETVVELTYDTKDPWPETADGDGASLELVGVTADPALPESWRASARNGGSPGNGP